MADCVQTSLVNCDKQFSNEKAYCLTRQTQNGKGAFIIEKKCVTKLEFYKNFPEEKHLTDSTTINDSELLESRCASTYDGYVNFCICDLNECNIKSLPEQAAEIALTRLAFF